MDSMVDVYRRGNSLQMIQMSRTDVRLNAHSTLHFIPTLVCGTYSHDLKWWNDGIFKKIFFLISVVRIDLICNMEA